MDFHYFAGANTASGFHSFYHYLSQDSFRRVFILKGGPGVGKSTLLKKIARDAKQFDIDHYHCSADVNSLDGIYIHGADISILDGTAPHVIDPKLPGAVQQIIDLGAAWNLTELARRRQEIESLVNKIGATYSEAYRWLALAAQWLELEWPCRQTPAVTKAAKKAAAEIIASLPELAVGLAKEAFGTAVTSVGMINYLPELAAQAEYNYTLSGSSLHFKQTILAEIKAYFTAQRIKAHYLFCGLRPENLEHIFVPGRIGIFSSHLPHPLKLTNAREISDGSETHQIPKTVAELIDKAVSKLSRARELHHQMEQIYIPNTNYELVNSEREKILAYILSQS